MGLFLYSHPGKNTLLYISFKAISFLVAVINSYYFNKYWVFHSQTNSKSKFSYFFIVSLVGFFLNVAVASIIYNILVSTYPTHIQIIANIGASMGTFIVLIWNFVGYKFLVFKT